jgi:hypothetical protein
MNVDRFEASRHTIWECSMGLATDIPKRGISAWTGTGEINRLGFAGFRRKKN